MKLVHNLKRGLAVTLCAAMLLGDSALLNAANVEGITATETVAEAAEQKVEETKLVEETTEATEQTEEKKSEEAQDEKKGLATTELNLSDIETTDASLLGTSMVATNSGSTVIEMMQSDASKYATITFNEAMTKSPNFGNNGASEKVARKTNIYVAIYYKSECVGWSTWYTFDDSQNEYGFAISSALLVEAGNGYDVDRVTKTENNSESDVRFEDGGYRLDYVGDGSILNVYVVDEVSYDSGKTHKLVGNDISDAQFTANFFDYDRDEINAATISKRVKSIPAGANKASVAYDYPALLFTNCGSINDYSFTYNGFTLNANDYEQNKASYNKSGGQNAKSSDMGVTQGLVDKKLDSNNLPSFSTYQVADLFNPEDNKYKDVYKNVNLDTAFTVEDGYYVLDSTKFNYRYNESDNKLNKANYRAYEGDNNKGYWPLNSVNNNQKNYWFGMSLNVPFNMTKTGTLEDKPIKFEFSGDDDVWVFIDDQLFLDLGGIHGGTSGNIDFSNGTVTVLKADKNVVVEDPRGNVISDGTKDYTKTFAELGLKDVRDNKSHTLRIFYLERGAGNSNCKIKFNLPQIRENKTDVVIKKIDDTTKDALAGATFELLNEEGESVGTATSDKDGLVTFKDIQEGSYTLKETAAPQGYSLDKQSTTSWHVLIYSDPSDYSKSVINIEGLTKTDGIYTIANVKDPLKIETSKVAALENDATRTYKLTLTAKAPVTKITNTTKTNADIAIIIDNSGSMIYTDAVIVSGNSRAEAFGQLSKLDTGKIYFTGTTTTYTGSSGYNKNVTARLMPGAYGTSRDGTGWWNVPSSGDYLFYANGQWYSRPISDLDEDYALETGNNIRHVEDGYWEYYKDDNGKYYYHFNLSGGYYDTNRPLIGRQKYSRRWIDTSYDVTIYEAATPITESTCPTKIYTNRSEVVRNAVNEFVAGLGEDSRVSIVTYNNEVSATGWTAPSTANTSSIAAKYNTATYTANALKKAKTKLDEVKNNPNNKNKQYAILFTDGESDSTESEMNNSSTALKGVAEVYAIGTNGTSGVLPVVATDRNHEMSLSDVSSLASTLEKIREDITETGSTGTVTDIVDSRFDLTDAQGKKIPAGDYAGGKVTINNGVYTITWKDQVIGDGTSEKYPVWSKSIYVTAKPDFMGGNKIPTNGAASGVKIDDVIEKFPQPTVNVKTLPVEVGEGEVTLFLAEDIDTPTYLKTLSSDIENVTWDNGQDVSKTFSTPYYYPGTADEIGTFEYKLVLEGTSTIDKHVSTVVGNGVEKYTLTKQYVPYSESQRNEKGLVKDLPTPVGNIAKTTSDEGVYIVNVVAGKLTITKSIKSGLTDKEVKQGDPIFTFKIVNTTTNKVEYRTLRFAQVGTESLSATIDNLPQGVYEVTELGTNRFKLDKMKIETTCDKAEIVNGYRVAIGFSNLNREKKSGYLDKKEAKVSFANKKANDDFFSDTDVVKNTYKVVNGEIVQGMKEVQSREGGDEPSVKGFTIQQ